MQNTLKYTSENGIKWKYKFDIYEKLGNYGGVEINDKTGNIKTYAYIAGARYKYADPSGSDWVNRPPTEDENDNWFKAVLNNDYKFNNRGNSYTYSSIRFEWMNDQYFERNFDARSEPETTFEMFGSELQQINERANLYWIYTIGTTFTDKKGANYVFAKETTKGTFRPIYVGETGDLSERFDNHHKMPCIKENGATHIHVRINTDESSRLVEESDLIKNYNPVCNG